MDEQSQSLGLQSQASAKSSLPNLTDELSSNLIHRWGRPIWLETDF